MRRALIAAVLLVAACSSAEEPAAAPTATSTASPTVATSETGTVASASAAASAGGGAVSIESDDGVLEFSYKHPAEVGAIPELAELLKAEADKARPEARKAALEDRDSAKTNDYEFHPHSLGYEWKVVTQTRRFLSLSNSFYSFTGGAHGNYGFEGLVWDRQANRRLAATDLFVSKAALKAAVLKAFCAGLDDERRKKGIDPPTPDESAFPRCVDPVSEATVILGSTNRRAIDRIGFLMDPYVAGSYAEGSYEVTLPVTPAILAAVKPEYRAEFATR